MNSFKVLFHHKAERELLKQNRVVTDRIIETATILERDPIPWRTHDVARIHGRENTYRIRMGDLRIVYVINWQDKTITVLRITSRGKAYKR